MKAALYDRYGPPSVLELREVAEPVPGPGELALRVMAASLHGIPEDDLRAMAHYLARLR